MKTDENKKNKKTKDEEIKEHDDELKLIEESEEERPSIEELFEELRQKAEARKLKFPQTILANPISATIYGFLLNLLIIVAINGYLNLLIIDSFSQLLLYIFTLTAIEHILKQIVMRFFPSLIVYTIGTIIFLINVSAIGLATLITSISFENMNKFIIFSLILLITRFIINQYLFKNVSVAKKMK